jgi:putative transposase
MSIDKDLLDQLMAGRSPGDRFGKTGILAELTKALAEQALSTEWISILMMSGPGRLLRGTTNRLISETAAARRP